MPFFQSKRTNEILRWIMNKKTIWVLQNVDSDSLETVLQLSQNISNKNVIGGPNEAVIGFNLGYITEYSVDFEVVCKNI